MSLSEALPTKALILCWSNAPKRYSQLVSQGSYVVARVGFEPATLPNPSTEPPRPAVFMICSFVQPPFPYIHSRIHVFNHHSLASPSSSFCDNAIANDDDGVQTTLTCAITTNAIPTGTPLTSPAASSSSHVPRNLFGRQP